MTSVLNRDFLTEAIMAFGSDLGCAVQLVTPIPVSRKPTVSPPMVIWGSPPRFVSGPAIGRTSRDDVVC